MSTTCKIGILRENGSVDCITCFRDGDPAYAGQILSLHYRTEDKINALLAGGNLLDINSTIETCVFEIRDRGQNAEANACQSYRSRSSYQASSGETDYLVIYMNNQWGYFSDFEDSESDSTR